MKAEDLIKKLKEIGSKTDADIEKIESVDGAVVVTFKKEEVFENKLPKSWEEFCDMFPVKVAECYIDNISDITEYTMQDRRGIKEDKNLLPDRATAEAVLALCQLIQLRNCYNGDWVPDWGDYKTDKYTIEYHNGIWTKNCVQIISTLLYFKSEELRDEFLRYFRPLIEKLKPLYGIKEGGEE